MRHYAHVQVKAQITSEGVTVERWPADIVPPPANREELASLAGFDNWAAMRKHFPGPYPTSATLTLQIPI